MIRWCCPSTRTVITSRRRSRDEHRLVFVRWNAAGAYTPDAVHIRVVQESIAFFDAYLKSAWLPSSPLPWAGRASGCSTGYRSPAGAGLIRAT